jgi:hypothetical protein
MATTAPMVILDLPIPGGFAIDSEDLAKLVKEEKIAKFQVTARQAIVYLRGLEPGKPLKLACRTTRYLEDGRTSFSRNTPVVASLPRRLFVSLYLLSDA